MLVRMSSRPPFTPEPQKRDAQILVANCIAGEAVVRIVPSNSFDRCNYATSASDRRVHGVFNWCPRSNSRTVNSPRPGRVASPPRHPCRPVQQSKVDRASMVTVWSGSSADKFRWIADATAQLHNPEAGAHRRQHRPAAQLLAGRPASRKNLKPCCLRGAFRCVPVVQGDKHRASPQSPPAFHDGKPQAWGDTLGAGSRQANGGRWGACRR